VVVESVPATKSQPPAPSEFIQLGWINGAVASGVFKLFLVSQEIRIAVQKFRSKSRGVERSQLLIPLR
jgi:hypothetical protein